MTAGSASRKGFDLLPAYLFSSYHHAPGIGNQERAAHFELALFVQFEIVSHMISHAGLLAKVDALFARPGQGYGTQRSGRGAIAVYCCSES